MKKGFYIVISILFVLIIGGLLTNSPHRFSENECYEWEDSCNASSQTKSVHPVTEYKKSKLSVVPDLPSFTPSDDGITQGTGEDSVELFTDILAGQNYQILIETGKRAPCCSLWNNEGDSVAWDFSIQVLRPSESGYFTKLLDYDGNGEYRESPFYVEISRLDSLPETEYCSIIFAEVDRKNKVLSSDPDSVFMYSGETRFPALASGTIIVQQASGQSKKLYIKVIQKGLLDVTISTATDACGYVLL